MSVAPVSYTRSGRPYNYGWAHKDVAYEAACLVKLMRRLERYEGCVKYHADKPWARRPTWWDEELDGPFVPYNIVDKFNRLIRIVKRNIADSQQRLADLCTRFPEKNKEGCYCMCSQMGCLKLFVMDGERFLCDECVDESDECLAGSDDGWNDE